MAQCQSACSGVIVIGEFKMRENMGLFRGLLPDVERFKWVFGGLVKTKCPFGGEDVYTIVDKIGNRTPVGGDSIGECTGLTDSDGRLIFENDIIEVKDRHDTFGSRVLYVAFDEGEFVLKSKSYNLYRASLRLVCSGSSYQCRVVGFMLNGTELYECP